MAETKVARIGAYDIHYADAGSGPALLLIHGLAGDHTAWLPQIAAWSGRFRVIAPDTRGAGRSTQRDEPVSTQDLARDFLALMTSLGIDKFHIVGRSMGGAIAQHMALEAPDRVLSAVMLASFAKLDRIGERCIDIVREVLEWTGSWDHHARHAIPFFVSAKFFNDNPEKITAIERLIGGSDRLQAAYVRQSHAVKAHDTLDRLKDIRCPVLVLSGGADPICGPQATRWMVDRLPDAEWIEFETSSHFFLMEEPQRFMDIMNRWFAKVVA